MSKQIIEYLEGEIKKLEEERAALLQEHKRFQESLNKIGQSLVETQGAIKKMTYDLDRLKHTEKKGKEPKK